MPAQAPHLSHHLRGAHLPCVDSAVNAAPHSLLEGRESVTGGLGEGPGRPGLHHTLGPSRQA